MGLELSNKAVIREATNNDMAKLKEIIDLSFPRFFRFFANRSVNSEEGRTLVADDQGVILGFAELIEFDINARKYGCILWIAVYPSHRRKGVAASLTNAGVDSLKKDGSQAVFASTQRRNHGALATLDRTGFVRIGFLGLRRLFGWRIFSFYSDIWFAPTEVVFMHP